MGSLRSFQPDRSRFIQLRGTYLVKFNIYLKRLKPSNKMEAGALDNSGTGKFD